MITLETDLKNALEGWWKDLSIVTLAVAGVKLPARSCDELWNGKVGQQLQILIKAATYQLDRGYSNNVYAVRSAMHAISEVFFYRSSPLKLTQRNIPDLPMSPIGQVYLAADLWLDRDRLLTLSQVSQMTGRSLSDLSNLIYRGKLIRYVDRNEPNPTYATRVRASEVLSLPRSRRQEHFKTDIEWKFHLMDMIAEMPELPNGSEIIELEEGDGESDWLEKIIVSENGEAMSGEEFAELASKLGW